ncbi:MAG: sulfurtransferase [Desulfovibrio sp.]|uniref:rhodanese-like domain-containing protein n=1 Tax=Desulfovibrio sp. TaxID=885 RepID=UPI00135E6DED|nr:rhodanese-like domain-containing protein [Desulfovibrio sp.]MTJ91839.1 sulfurtransferase [Desulfovibrio sp.]
MGETITPQELQALLDSKSATVCDVRREVDYQADPRTIAGAEWHNPEAVDAWAGQLPKDRPVAIYCVRGGSVSKSVHAALTAKGFDVSYLEGGLAAWDAAGK